MEGGGVVDQWSISFSFSVSNLAIMNSHVIIIVFLFVLNCAAIDPPSHEFRVRTHEGSKTIVQDGVKKKISVMRVFMQFQANPVLLRPGRQEQRLLATFTK